jgi:hypothetical protein
VGKLGREVFEYENRVTAIVNDDDDLTGYVARLESMGDDDLDLEMNDDHDDDLDGDDGDDVVAGGEAGIDLEPIDVAHLDSDELMAEVEKFLRDQPEQ